MPYRQLKDLLMELHEALARRPRLDEETVAALGVLVDDIGRLAHEADDASGSDAPAEPSPPTGDSISGRLESLLAQFETRHPRLANTLGNLVDRLADLGI